MAVRAAIEKKPLGAGYRAQGMAAMALEAKKRHGGIEKIIVHRTMGRMTVGTVFGYIAMFKCKRALFLHMAPGAGLFR